jgi:hypothetical protein
LARIKRSLLFLADPAIPSEPTCLSDGHRAQWRSRLATLSVDTTFSGA